MALMSAIPRGKGIATKSNGYHAICRGKVHQRHFSHRPWRISPQINSQLKSSKEDNYDGTLDEDGYSIEKDDDVSDNDDEYFDRFISDALTEEEPSNSKDDDSSSSSDDDTLSETKRMMKQQQQQIDMLMKLVQQQQKQSTGGEAQSSKATNAPPPQSIQQSQPPATPTTNKNNQKSINVAPLKAMLFIDGTWLYYSLNTRNPSRDAIIPKFGMGWQNSYKVDW